MGLTKSSLVSSHTCADADRTFLVLTCGKRHQPLCLWFGDVAIWRNAARSRCTLIGSSSEALTMVRLRPMRTARPARQVATGVPKGFTSRTEDDMISSREGIFYDGTLRSTNCSQPRNWVHRSVI